jgi:hypothetical protein
MNPYVGEIAIWTAPVMLAIIGFFFQREFTKQDERTEELFKLIRDELPKQFVGRPECIACKVLTEERISNNREIWVRLERNIGGLTDQIEVLDKCLRSLPETLESKRC